MTKREDPVKKLLTRSIIDAMTRLENGNWFEVNTSQHFTKTDDAFKRALRLCVKYGWMEDGPAITSTDRHKAYRMTPQGYAVYDKYKLKAKELAH